MSAARSVFKTSMSFLVARDTKSNQILGRVITQAAPRLDVMYLETLNASAHQCIRTIDNAIHLAPGPPGRVGDTLQGRASIVVVW